jgi:hypothetical protein
VAPHLLDSTGLGTFHVFPLTGPAARNKGMPLFLRLVQDQFLAPCRGDGETIKPDNVARRSKPD